ncbi:MAG: hypothetical protein K1X94_05645 [Sandaracinaceae bacterium]|nr:hypothetical protein [Sandaracinaceae bacterium]
MRHEAPAPKAARSITRSLRFGARLLPLQGLQGALRPVLLGTLLGLASCGGSAPRIVVTPITTAQRAVFENGVDFIDDPTLLEGNWLETWEQEIDLRVRSSDIVAYVRVTTMRTDTDLERHETHRLVAHIDSLRHGTGVDDELELVVRQGDPGFDTVHDQDRRILNQRFVAFVKWTQDGPDDPIVARWHLSPASERVVRRVNTLIESQHAPDEDRRRVIVHDQPADDEEQ